MAQSFRLSRLRAFAAAYTAAWCSRDPNRVATRFAPQGSLTINGGSPAVGRKLIGKAVLGFMETFPDLVVTMDEVTGNEDEALYQWTLAGTYRGPGGNGHRVLISGFEKWTLTGDWLIRASQGHFDQADFERQLNGSLTITAKCATRSG